jgi:hypothetical protein
MVQAKLARLIEEYHASVEKYSEAVRRLNGLSGLEFERAYHGVEALHEITERCRAALEQYKREL